MIGTMEPPRDRRNGASFTLTDVSTFRGPPLPCRVWQERAGGPQEHRDARVPPGPDAFASGRFGARDCPLRFDGPAKAARFRCTRSLAAT